MASFVSANELTLEREKRKEERRKYRKEILEEAKESFQKEKKKRELRVERGDDKWVAPGIDQRLEYSYEKKKKRKKHKKEKKHKTNQTKDEERNETPSDDSEQEMWVEKADEQGNSATPTDNEPQQRQEWMMIPLGPSAAAKKRLGELSEIESSQRKAKEEEEKEKKLLDQPGQHPLELNPYWKSGGCGLPEKEKEEESIARHGDGGRSWLLRSYKRALERSQEEGISMEEIASERWGSLETLHERLREAGIDPLDPDSSGGRGRRQYLYSNYRKEREEVSSVEYSTRRKLDKPEYKPFRPSRGFVRPDNGGSSKYFGKSQSNSSQSWQKKSSQVEQRDESSGPPSLQSDSSPSPPPQISPPPPLPQLVTDAQLNSLGAKLTKAEIMGDTEKVEKLKRQLEELRELQRSQRESGIPREEVNTVRKHAKEHEEQVVILTKTDRLGRVRPLGSSHSSSSGSRDRYNPKGSTHTDKGKRKKYFADDDRYSLKALVEQEQVMTAEETHSAIARMASKFVPSTNFDETVDDVLDSKSVLRHDPQKEEERVRKRAVAENRAMSEALRSCRLCIDNEQFEKQLLVAIGLEVYLAAPSHEPLTEGHCLLIPREHTTCAMQMDENVWSEIGIFRKGLTRMFADRDMDVMFMETYSSTYSKHHMQIECIPLPKEVGELAPMYFKKAIMESDVEWSDNKKLIDTSNKGVRGSLPKGLPYFFVEFGTDGGYGHIIEDQSKFPWHFGKEVCGGMLDVEPRLWLKPRRESFERQKLRVLQISQWWKPYDWTQKLIEQNE